MTCKCDEFENALSTEKRKSLSSSTFCAPHRGFPVDNCARYTSALRLLGRAKLSTATKAKVRACILRKGKALGCTKDYNLTEEEYREIISSPDLEPTIELIAWMEDIEEDRVREEEEKKLDMVLGKKF